LALRVHIRGKILEKSQPRQTALFFTTSIKIYIFQKKKELILTFEVIMCKPFVPTYINCTIFPKIIPLNAFLGRGLQKREASDFC